MTHFESEFQTFYVYRVGRGKGKSRRKSLVLKQFLPSTECFHEIIMLFISWHTKYLKNCKWYFQAVFDFILTDFLDLLLFLMRLTDKNQIENTSQSFFLYKIFLSESVSNLDFSQNFLT